MHALVLHNADPACASARARAQPNVVSIAEADLDWEVWSKTARVCELVIEEPPEIAETGLRIRVRDRPLGRILRVLDTFMSVRWNTRDIT